MNKGIQINPVLSKELKVKMRGWRGVAILMIYLVILTLVAVFITYANNRDIYGPTISSDISMGAYMALAIFQFALILFIVPALTAGTLSGEREKQTLDLLLCTRLSSFEIVMGKLFASMSHMLLLIVASLPLFSIVFIYGGISILEILSLFAFYLVTAIMLGSMGIFFSAYVKRTTSSTVLTYGMVAFLTIGTFWLTLFYVGVFYGGNYKTFPFLLYTNPIMGFTSLLGQQFGSTGSFGDLLGFGTAPVRWLAPWFVNLFLDAVLTVVFVALAAWRVNPLRKGFGRER